MTANAPANIHSGSDHRDIVISSDKFTILITALTAKPAVIGDTRKENVS